MTSQRPIKTPLFQTGGWIVDFCLVPRLPDSRWVRVKDLGIPIPPFDTENEARQWAANRAFKYRNSVRCYDVRYVSEDEPND